MSRERDSWTCARRKAEELSLPLLFALTRSGIRKDSAEKYVEGIMLPTDATVNKFLRYLDGIEAKRKRFYAG